MGIKNNILNSEQAAELCKNVPGTIVQHGGLIYTYLAGKWAWYDLVKEKQWKSANHHPESPTAAKNIWRLYKNS